MKFLVRIIFILFISVNIFAQDNLSRMKKIKIIEEKNQGKYIVRISSFIENLQKKRKSLKF